MLRLEKEARQEFRDSCELREIKETSNEREA